MDLQRGRVFRVNLEPMQGSEQQGTARLYVILSITPLNARLRQVGPLSNSARALPRWWGQRCVLAMVG